jgi:transmembrane sensor
VTRDERPFLVITENARTTVLGTEFNVWARNEQTRVIVREGSVRFKSINADDGDVLLLREEMSRITGNQPPQVPKRVDTERLLGWLEGRLVFEKTPLTEILDELERYYDVFIESADSELAQETLTATFDHLPLETVLSSICLTLGAQYRFEDEKYIILNNS